jgi:hypothetical protein
MRLTLNPVIEASLSGALPIGWGRADECGFSCRVHDIGRNSNSAAGNTILGVQLFWP